MNSKIDFNLWLQLVRVLPPQPCSYFPNLYSRFRAFVCNEPLSKNHIDLLLSEGYRRSGNFFYQNQCPNCQLCQSYRLRLDRFQPSRSQKKVLRKNQDLRIEIRKPNYFRPKEKRLIYLRYFHHRHHQTESTFSAKKTLRIMNNQMYHNSDQSVELVVFLREKILGYAIIDIANLAASAVYLVFDTGYAKRSLGTYIILAMIAWAQKTGFRYLNLGFYIADHRKMSYKKNFGPAEVLDPRTMKWSDFVS